MSTVYSVYVHEHVTAEGLLVTQASGELADAGGTRVVLLPGGRVLAAEGFCPTKADALLIAAMRAEEIGRRILAQAERMRAEAGITEAAA